MKLFEITSSYIEALRPDENGELLPEALERLDTIAEEAQDKIVSVASYIKNLEAEKEAVHSAIDNMRQREARLNAAIASLGDYLKSNMQTMGIDEVKRSPYFKVRLKKCPLSVSILNEEIIPMEFKKVKETVNVDKLLLKEHLANGEEIPGACLQQNIKVEIK